MRKFIGDLSTQDEKTLRFLATISHDILEFGVGGSTQIIQQEIQSLAADGIDDINFLSLDTSQEWIDITIKNMTKMNLPIPWIAHYEHFMNPDVLQHHPKEHFDLVFDDGVDNLRRDFAERIWPYIKPEGVLAFHDTRRPADMDNFLYIVNKFKDEIETVDFNVDNSNISLIWKKNPTPFENWQITENLEKWEFGHGEPPEDFFEQFKVKPNE